MKKLADIAENLRPASAYKLLINGEWRDGHSGKTFESINPATGEKLADIAEADAEDVDLAVKGAQEAFKTWRKTTPQERQTILHKIADLMEENIDRLAMLETLDNGKPLTQARSDVRAGADHFRYFAAAIRVRSDEADLIDEEHLSIVLSEPLGVVGQIIPWNFPILMGMWKIAPALAAGNCIVIKPAENTSISLLELGKLITEAEILPKGVLNILSGFGQTTGQYILNHEGFSKFAFTGSTGVGKIVAQAAAEKIIPATLELGGKSANIVFEDAQLDRAAEEATLAILYNQGQVCTAGSRLFVQSSIYDKFIEMVKRNFENFKVGDPLDKATQMGAQISEAQMNQILKYIEIAKEEGATIATGGERVAELSEGFFIKPTLITDVKSGMRVEQEEIFGPVLVVVKFETEEEVIEYANNSEYGLGGAVWSRDINRAIRVARSIETGRMWVNCYNRIPAHAPFGGYKKSGLGRETHKMAIDAYTQKKNIFISTSETPFGIFS